MHPLVRAAVYDDLSLTRRRELHLACARLTSGATALAHRIAASPGADDDLAAEVMATAHDEVTHGALSAGIDHLLLASRVAGSQGGSGGRAAGGGGLSRRRRRRTQSSGPARRGRGLRGQRRAQLRVGHAERVGGSRARGDRRARGRSPSARTSPRTPACPVRVTSSLAIISAYAGRGVEAVRLGASYAERAAAGGDRRGHRPSGDGARAGHLRAWRRGGGGARFAVAVPDRAPAVRGRDARHGAGASSCGATTGPAQSMTCRRRSAGLWRAARRASFRA